LAWLETQQEYAELKRYNEAKVQRDAVLNQTVKLLQGYWYEQLQQDFAPGNAMMTSWVKTFGPQEVEIAIDKAGVKLAEGKVYGGFDGLVRYTAGVLWARLKAGANA